MAIVRVLGPVDVVADDGSVQESGSALRRTLLALLAIHRGVVLSPDWLMEHVWGDEQPDSGVRALRFHVSRLRKECEAAPIATRPGGYQLDLPAGGVDAGIFEELARQARVEHDEPRSVELCDRALALWRGAPFVDAAPCSTLDHEAGRLDELRLSVIELSYGRRLQAGAAGELISDLMQLVNEYPLREGLWSSLITAQYRAGQQAEALASHERLRVSLAESLGLDPSPELQDLQLRVLRQDPDLAASATPAVVSAGSRQQHNLPELATSFIEPAGGLDESLEMIDAHRLVTLTGTGGVGKTRLAIELGWRSLDRFRDGVRLIELARVLESDAVVGAMLSELSGPPQSGMSMLESLVDWFRGRELLLIIDNCEHVIDVVSEVVAAIVARCPTVVVLATSREPLEIDGERVRRVAPLERADAVELFKQRAEAAGGTFVADRGDADVLNALCQRLDGVPLAIELAAARSGSISPTELLEHLDDRFRLLHRTGRSRHTRHDTLRATVAWSYQLLDDDERLVFERASVFAGGFDLAAAQAVCATGEIGSLDVMDLVSSLVDKSMITADRHATRMRYRLLETLREFGEEQLVEHHDRVRVHDRHLDCYVEVAERIDRMLRSPDEASARQMFNVEWGNLRSAHDWAIATKDLDRAERLLAAIGLYSLSDIRHETADWVERTLGIATRPANPYMYSLASQWAIEEGRYEAALNMALHGIQQAPSPDHPGTVLCWAVIVEHQLSARPGGRRREIPSDDPVFGIEAALTAIEAAVTGHGPVDDWLALANLVDVTQRSQLYGAEPVEAVRFHAAHVARLAEAAERVGAPTLHAFAVLYRGHQFMLEAPPDAERALEHYARGIGIARDAQNRYMEGRCLRAVACATTDLAVDSRAASACRAALEHLHNLRKWETLRQTMESAVLILATLGDIRQASVTLGHLIEVGRSFAREIIYGFRDRSLKLVQHDDQSASWMALGAQMDSDQVAIDTIEHLALLANEP